MTLYCIFARNVDTAIIFRRGPSSQVLLIKWDLKTNEFQPGQWFKGRIYESKCDLSPDGNKLVYFAAKHAANYPTWVAVSTPPFLTALLLWKKTGTWDGLNTFESDTVLKLGVYNLQSSLTPEEGYSLPPHIKLVANPWPGYFYRLADHERLVRDGWQVYAGNPIYDSKSKNADAFLVYRKFIRDVRSGYLQMTVRGHQDIVYTICDDAGALLELKAHWADTKGQDVFYSHGVKLFRVHVIQASDRTECAKPVVLADFSDMKFSETIAPESAMKWGQSYFL